MSRSRLFIITGLLGAAGVLLGAVGAHRLHDQLLQRQTDGIWQTAVFYHLVHTVGLLALASLNRGAAERPPAALRGAAICWITGIVFFSGSLYWLALGAPRALGPVTPAGGLLLVAGWALVAVHGLRRLPTHPPGTDSP